MSPASQRQARILVVEDDPSIRLGLEINLRAAGYEVLCASEGHTGLRLAQEAGADLLVLDLRLPGLHGLEVLRHLRDGGSALPVLVLSALGEEHDKVAGLRRGADDYVTKPFGLTELMARIEALLRRSGGMKDLGLLRFGGVELDLQARQARRDGEEVHLTPTEMDLLEVLVRSPSRAFSRIELLERVWGRDYDGTERTVDNFVTSLRRKLERKPRSPQHLLTVRGHGYRFQP